MNYVIPDLFALGDLESKSVFKACTHAHRALGELKGVVHTMPNPNILLGTLPLQEAKESSEIENIVTTQDDLYQSNYATQQFASGAAKEVHHYVQAMNLGFHEVQKSGLITLNLIKEIQRELEGNNAGFRKQAGTGLVNQATQEVVYMPPQTYDEIENLMSGLERFINDSEQMDYDPLVKMALIHHQFESIHPFYDGNGRTGRIINILYLIQQGLLDTPVLYLSRYINRNKGEYYQLLQAVRETQQWEPWLIFMLNGIAETAIQSVKLINEIKALMMKQKQMIRENLPKVYSHELLNNLFKYPYTKIDFVMEDCQIHRNTAVKRLDELVALGVLAKTKIGKENFYINVELFHLLMQ
ncbi:Fic family protein [Glaesserella parasuis]|uniref:Fic family protein n=1 Tax=Glaesserella parasuis TaxID=738 RepID=UPI0021C1CC61|nr:Fic family protein [Glaesserella parasuis]MCT8703908.1 Fic family protein [Glaesserella parasuis]MCT8705686.1 Fic family protein [Glaesserella parasuis]MCT8707703.1 Fic family protein [Glaesserella parasuis]MCT8709891.1 Fic family protein [Glaesserella parasuis]